MKIEKIWEEKYSTQEALNNSVPDSVCLHFAEQKKQELEITIDDQKNLQNLINSIVDDVDL